MPTILTARSLAFCAAIGSLYALATPALGVIRPTSATATSEFSSLYDIGNAIDGSGLPAGFGPGSSHANYTTNNHWTTAANQTIGQSATFSFSAPQTLNRFYMWNHRSNNIASNADYAVTRFDLVFRGSDGAELRRIDGLTAIGGVSSAQIFCFTDIAGVSSVQFIVRATQNNNASIYTGLAEVAFDNITPCGSADVAGPGQSSCVDGQLTADDLIVFVNRFFASDARADIAGSGQTLGADGQFSADDIIVFVGLFFTGC